MKWLFFKRTDDREVYIREDDIDYIVTYHKFAKIYLKNGKDQLVNNIGLGQRIMENESANLKNDLARASMDIQNKDDEIQDLKLENDRLAKRDVKMHQVIRSIACDPDCEFCLLRGSECSARDMQLLAMQTLKELEDL